MDRFPSCPAFLILLHKSMVDTRKRYNHICPICKEIIRKRPHKHCEKCLAPSEYLIDWPDAVNRWGCNEIYHHKCQACGHTWKEVVK